MIEDVGVVYCTSCEDRATGFNGVAHSHNLPKGTHPEFETDKWNISPRCLKCHRALDDHNFEMIKDFKDLFVIMAYRKRVKPGEYNKFVTGLLEVGCADYAYVEFDK